MSICGQLELLFIPLLLLLVSPSGYKIVNDDVKIHLYVSACSAKRYERILAANEPALCFPSVVDQYL